MNKEMIVMNKEEILNKYIDLIDKGYCCDCNELNCIDNFPHAKITHAIRELQQQCKKQKEVIDKTTDIINDYLKEDYSIYTENEIEVDLIVKLKNMLKEVSE